MKQKTLELQKLYKEGAEILAAVGIEESSLDAWYLLEYVTGISKAAYFGNPFREIDESEADRYFDYIEERSRRIPLQHITGSQEFMGYEFLVNEHVLIPRQDTECLVEEALKVLEPGMSVLDMCTGSGCILLSLLKMGRERRGITDVNGLGVDISTEALKVAGENAKRLGVEVDLIQSNLFENVKRTEKKYQLIVSNPPYIRTKVIEELQDEVRLHDPFIALDGKEDGLHFYRRIIEDSVNFICQGGRLMFEIGHDQGKNVSELMKEAGYIEVDVKKDLAGLDRVVVGMYNKR
ncbi:MAG: peptide chain release factor N(5)-glutamine methyltransferase [Dorea sp.]